MEQKLKNANEIKLLAVQNSKLNIMVDDLSRDKKVPVLKHRLTQTALTNAAKLVKQKHS